MILKQFYLSCLAHASYVVGDESTGTAWVIDPQRDVQVYLDFAREHGLTITDVALTHLHADFVAGHLELRDRVGARVHLGSKAAVGYTIVPAEDGAEYTFGTVRLVAWHTPGHTPEGVTWLVYDDSVSTTVPAAALTGDTLFIGDVGRPDLLASAGMQAADLAGMLHTSIKRLLTLDDQVLVYPAHGAGSLCGRNLSKQTVSTIGEERAHNYALQPMSREAFIERVSSEQPPAPAYFLHDVQMNKSEHATNVDPAASLDVATVLELVREGSQLLDARDPQVFAAAHVHGAINVGVDGQFAMWVGAVLDPKEPVVIIAEPGREDEVVMRLRRVGFDQVDGFLEGGMASFHGHETVLEAVMRYPGPAFEESRQSSHPPLVLDVRNPGEREAGFIPGSHSVPLPTLVAAVAELPHDREIVVHCAGGYRSMIAASVIAASGRRVADLLGGYQAWLLATSAQAKA
jgi:hydroxyacylglutathione hydrolase